MARKPAAPVTVERMTPEERLIAAVVLGPIETDPEAASLKRLRDRKDAEAAAAAAAYEAASTVEIESLHKGGTLHLGDGRKLAFGETAHVTPEIAAMLRKNGQAK